MKKIVLIVLVAFTTTSGLKAQISSFDIAEKRAFVYLGWTPGYNYSSFEYQMTDWIEVGVHYPVWRGLNINAGISMNVNFQSIEDLGLVYSDYVNKINDYGDTKTPESSYLYEDDDFKQIRGAVFNAGVSYTIGSGSFKLIPSLGLSICQEWNVYEWDGPGLEQYRHEIAWGAIANPYLGFDIAYKNYLIGFNSNFVWQENKDIVSLRIGYGFPLKKSKMNF